MNHSWGYKAADQDYKSVKELVHLLVRTSGKGANLLLNIGPQPDGTLPEAALKRLSEMGKWLASYGESIYATGAGGYSLGDSIITTRNDNHLYIHLLDTAIDHVSLPVSQKVKSVEALGENCRVDYTYRRGNLDLKVDIPDNCIDYVVKVTFK